MSRERASRYGAALDMELDSVRIHTGPVADVLVLEHNALALAYGSHIVLGEKFHRLPAPLRETIFAHELVHVVQQCARPLHAANDARYRPPVRGPPSVHKVVPQVVAPIGVQCFAEGLSLDVFSDAADAVVEAGEGAWETAGNAVDAVGGAVVGGAEAAVEFLAPGLLEFLRGGVSGQLTDMFCSGVNSVTSGVFSALEDIDIMTEIETAFTDFAAGVRGVGSSLRETASDAVGSVLGPLVESLGVWGGPLVKLIQDSTNTVNSLFTGLWDNFAVPALDFLEFVGGTVWEGFTSLLSWLWDLVQPIRDGAAWAWEWLTEQFDIAWNSSAESRSWISEKATEAWDAFTELIEPIKAPLMIVGGVLILLSPLGPIIILTQIVPPLWEKISWLWNNWNSEDILVSAREILAEEILPGIIGSVTNVATRMADAASWLSAMVATFGIGMSRVLGAFGINACLKTVTQYLNHIANQFTRLADWARGGFAGLGSALESVFDALVAFFQPILDFLVRLLMVAMNPPLLPFALAAGIWLLLPDTLKPPVIIFILDLLLAFLPGFTAFLIPLGPLAFVMHAALMGFLEHLRSGSDVTDQLRIDASNKIANLMAGGGIAFVGGFALGLLRGLIDGILDPFKLIFLIVQVMVTAVTALAKAMEPFVSRHVPGFQQGINTVRAEIDTSPTLNAIASAEPVADGNRSGAPTGARAPPETSAATQSASSATASTTVAETAPVATPVATESSSTSAANDAARSSADVAAAEAFDATVDISDAQIAASMSPARLTEVAAAPANDQMTAESLEIEMRSEVQTRGSSVGGLATLLGDAWDAIIGGATKLGGTLAGAMLGFIAKSDFDIGMSLGWVGGMILFELLLAYFTAGGYTVVKSTTPLWRVLLSYLLRFLDIGGEIFAVVGRALKPLKAPFMRGWGAAKNFLGKFKFARGMLDKVDGMMTRLFGFSDEVSGAQRAVGEAADSGGARVVSETAETAGQRASSGSGGRAGNRAGSRTATESTQQASERVAADVMQTRTERATADAVENMGEGGFRAVDEPGVPRIRDDALKGLEFVEAKAAGRLIAETNDRLNTSVPATLAQLMLMKRRYRWIDTFTAELRSPGHYRIDMIASKTPMDEDYSHGASYDLVDGLQPHRRTLDPPEVIPVSRPRTNVDGLADEAIPTAALDEVPVGGQGSRMDSDEIAQDLLDTGQPSSAQGQLNVRREVGDDGRVKGRTSRSSTQAQRDMAELWEEQRRREILDDLDDLTVDPPRERPPGDLFDDPNAVARGTVLERPGLNVDIIDTIEGAAPKNANGDFLYPNHHPKAGQLMDRPSVGHIHGRENRRILAAGKEVGLTQEQVGRYVNSRPEFFEIEEWAENVAHLNEMPGRAPYGSGDPVWDIVADMEDFFR